MISPKVKLPLNDLPAADRPDDDSPGLDDHD